MLQLISLHLCFVWYRPAAAGKTYAANAEELVVQTSQWWQTGR